MRAVGTIAEKTVLEGTCQIRFVWNTTQSTGEGRSCQMRAVGTNRTKLAGKALLT